MGQGYDDNTLGSVVTSNEILDGTIANADISSAAEVAVSKLADGTARQLLQTDAAGTGVEWASNIDVPGTLDVTGATTLDSTLSVAGVATLNATPVVSSASPQISFKDTDAAAGDVNAYLLVAATDTGDGSEDIDFSLYQQVAGGAQRTIFSDADAGIWLYPSGGTTGLLAVTPTQTYVGAANGQTTAIKTKTETVTFAADPGSATAVTTGSIIPAGAYVVGVTGRVTVADTSGQVTSMDIGIAAKDTDAFADGVAVTLGTTFTVADGNAGADYSAASLGIQPSVAAQEITITGVGGDGNAENLAVALTVHYIDCTAATS